MMKNSTSGRAARITGCAAALAVIATLTAAPAWAHVHVEADHTAPGDDAILTFAVPNESDKGAATTEVTVALPDLTEVSAEQIPGWTARLDRNVSAGTVKSVTWTAAPGAGIAPDQFALFRVAVMLPKSDSASFPTTQTYGDGTVVHWDQPTPAGGAEPEYPSPTIALKAESHDDAPMSMPSPDNTSRWLAGAALIVAAASLVVTLVSRRRHGHQNT